MAKWLVMKKSHLPRVATLLLCITTLSISDAGARLRNSTTTGPGGKSISSQTESKTRFKKGSGVSNTSSTTVTGPRGKEKTVEHEGTTTYEKDNGVTHTSETTTTTPAGNTVSSSSSKNIQANPGTGVQSSGTGSVQGPGGKTQTINTQSTTTKSEDGITTKRQIVN